MLTYKELQEKGICWTGYKRKKGTKPYEEGSCVKEELEKHHAMAFGRMNPITSGHESVVNKLHSVAKEHGASHNLIVSHSQDAKKNPLSSEQKVAHAKNAFHGTNVTAASKESPTILHHAAAAHAAGATHLHVVAGSDRHEEMHNLLHKYNGQKAAHGHYNFKKITVHSSGERDPDAEGTTGISASKMREHAASGNKAEFHKGAPSKMKPEHKDAMYNDVRKGMNIKEELEQVNEYSMDDLHKDSAAHLKKSLDKQSDDRIAALKNPPKKKGFFAKVGQKQINMVKGAYHGLTKEETVDQQDDRKQQLKRFKDQMSQANGPQKETETELDKLEKELMTKTNSNLMVDVDTKMHPRHAKINHMTESLRPEMGAETYIKDFISSTHPKFNNKSKEERRKMAIGAYMAAKARGVKEEVKKEDPPFDGPYTSSFKKPTNPNRTGMDSARSLAQRAMDQVKKKPVKEETLDERNKENALMRKTMDASRGAKFKLNNPVPDADPKHKTARDHNVAIGRALRNEAMTGNPGNGYHGQVQSPDEKYEATHKHVKNLTDADDKTVKHYLDSGHGRHLAGREEDHEYIKKDFKKFKKHYRPEMHEGVLQDNGTDKIEPTTSVPKKDAEKSESKGKTVKGFKFFNGQPESQSTGIVREAAQKGVNVDDVNTAGQEPHEEKWEPVKKNVTKLKKVKEGNMKSYKEFVQSLEEKLIGKQKKLDKNHNGELDSQDFKMLRKEETEALDEIKMSELPVRKIQGRSYGADYNDPEGADDAWEKEKTPKAGKAGRKTGQRTGSYKPRATMSKLKQAGATYK